MQHLVMVVFDRNTEFEYRLTLDESSGLQEEARVWFEREFLALECDVATPTGKILAVDRVLSVAKYAGAQKFSGDTAWVSAFAKYASALLGRELIRIDVEHYTIGY